MVPERGDGKLFSAGILPGDLIAGGRFNLMSSMCWTEQETKDVNKLIYGKNGSGQKRNGSTIMVMGIPGPLQVI